MSADSKIEWTDHTFNPWEGCTKVSPGCAHCYAETRNARWHGGTAPNWGKGAPRRRTSAANWKQPRRWNTYPYECPSCGERYQSSNIECYCSGATIVQERRQRVFCASLADWLDDEVPIEWLAELLALIHECQNLDWQLLTKRPGNWEKRIAQVFNTNPAKFDWVLDWKAGRPPANVWLGTTVENQDMADERIPQLLAIPAQVRFLSCEPLLSEVNIGPWVAEKTPMGLRILQRHWKADGEFDVTGSQPDYEFQIKKDHGLHWLIAGGESGKDARPMHPDWARSLRDQCAAAGVPFLFKQWGEWAPTEGDTQQVTRVGKKAAGRLLDGREWNQFPEVRA